MVLSLFPKTNRGYVVSMFTIFNVLSSSLGMIVGGVLLRVVSWRILFLGNAPLVALAIPLGKWMLPDCNDPRKGMLEEGAGDNPEAKEEDEKGSDGAHDDIADKTEAGAVEAAVEGKHQEEPEAAKKGLAAFDWVGAGLLSGCFGLLLFGLNRIGPWGLHSRWVLGLLFSGVVLSTIFVMHQQCRGRDALLPPFFLKDPMICTCITMKICMQASYCIALLLLPYYLEEALLWTPEEASYLLAGRPFAFFLSSYYLAKKMRAATPIGTVSDGRFCDFQPVCGNPDVFP